MKVILYIMKYFRAPEADAELKKFLKEFKG